MIVLFGKTSGPKARQYFGRRTNLGIMVGPKGWVNAWCPHWACDNDAYNTRHDPGYWCREGETRWLKMLDKAALQPSKPLFCVLPDVVSDWKQTLERAHRYEQEVRGRGLPLAVALQDGCYFSEALALRPEFVFVGGSTEWKWANAHLACDPAARRTATHVVSGSQDTVVSAYRTRGLSGAGSAGTGRAHDHEDDQTGQRGPYPQSGVGFRDA